ncbi:hypothetical protein BH24ACT3_BH24ACT3_11840 [soil metagenome]
MRPRRATLAAIAFAVACSGCGISGTDGDSPTAGPPALAARPVAALRPAEDCADLLGWFREQAEERVSPYGLTQGPGADETLFRAGDSTAQMDAAAPAAGAERQATAEDAGGFSTTNVQEEGVDEADRVKSDGQRLLVLHGDRLSVLNIADGPPRLAGSVTVPPSSTDLLMSGERALVIGGDATDELPNVGGDVGSSPVSPVATVQLTEIDLSDQSQPAVRGSISIDGSYVSARRTGENVRLVIRSGPSSIPFVEPAFGGGPGAEAAATEANEAAIASSTIEDWLPAQRPVDSLGRPAGAEQTAVNCDSVHHPDDVADTSLVSVLTVDLSEPLAVDDGAAVAGGAETVYASAEHLYVASVRWPTVGAGDWSFGPGPATTEVHRFAIGGDQPAAYQASGAVEGTVLNQFALSEHQGDLRVATTTNSFGPTEALTSESGLTVLRRDGERLEAVGRVSGLGPTEEIRSVRFLGETAYVVTFRQTDPLYVLDLSDPTEPTVTGELKIPGYSAYLHPVADGRLLGVGQDADETGRVRGAQVSLFDVSDPSRPERIDQMDLGPETYSSVESDHRSFLWWAPEGLAVVPVESYGIEDTGGARVLRVEGDTLVDAATVRPTDSPVTGGMTLVDRSLVIGERLLTVSAGGVQANDLATLAPEVWVPLG